MCKKLAKRITVVAMFFSIATACNSKIKTVSDRLYGQSGAPSTPQSVTGVAGDQSVSLQWTAPDNEAVVPVLDYKIRYTTNNGTSWQEFNDGTVSSTTAQITGLTNDVPHVFQVAAVGENSTSDYSPSSARIIPRATTLAAQPPLVLGQPDLFSNQVNISGLVTANSLNLPMDVYSDGTQVVVADTSNHRVLIWNSLPTEVNQAADVVLGQLNMNSNAENSGGSVSASSLSFPYGVHIVGERLFVADSGNHRVLVWEPVPTQNNQPANYVLGQSDLTSSTYPLSANANTLKWPTDVFSDGTRMFVVDHGNHRVLIWSSMPTSSGESADLVLGQADFSGNKPNRYLNVVALGNSGSAATPTPTPITGEVLNSPSTVFSDGIRLVVTDTSNSRVLVWNTMPTTNGQHADLVLGQPDFATITQNPGGVSASSMFNPWGVSSFDNQLFVSDQWNNRVLIWNSFPTQSDQAADRVLGQPSAATSDINFGGVSESSLARPGGMTVTDSNIFISDPANNRVLIVPLAPK